MSEIQIDKRQFAQHRVLKTLEDLVTAAYAKDGLRLSQLSTAPLRHELISGAGELFDVIASLGQLHLMPVPTVAVDGRRSIVLFTVQGNDHVAFQPMYAALVRTDDMRTDAKTKADIARHAWAVTTLGKTAPVLTPTSREVPVMHPADDSDSTKIDWDDPSFVIEKADELAGRPECTVADVLREAEKFTEKGLGLVGRAGGTRVSEYVRERRPELM